MAKCKVYSRLPDAIKFVFNKNEDGTTKEAEQITDEDVIILNGTSRVQNHGLVVTTAMTEFADSNKHNIRERRYSMDDLARLKEHPVFQAMLADGNLALGSEDDLSTDDGVGMLSESELKRRLEEQNRKSGEDAQLAMS